MSVVLRRIYEEDEILGGHRVLIDRVWPRGISKEAAHLDEWIKEIAPSSSLRKWFNHDPDKFQTFKESYQREINENSEASHKLNELKEIASDSRVVLLFGAKDKEHNHAVVLKEMIEK
ncbi:uroporphyrin-III methyltransferase [Pontibacillus chungwhensis BH030062]|uniref:Uroporphyrin-III methyltransferase n=1 Tax=Pontibacillus chungwhensis BH030062 TaxID=1385513 RepID=A0A0A2UPU4_9BACI|nr:DUF488 family protein [Pontibacillus chungwhensis]KGP89954.1 uroporphyrin-III methyltransferase [Pontibacillus chungwhensis BH030062]